jgi:glycosyltransferase involved in cell wall biosynthesis
MKISVITANFNGEKYLPEAIKSVLRQDYNNFEYIIVDDASTDASGEIINKFHHNHADIIRPIFNTENFGQGVCFTSAVSVAQGDIVCFLDSDDYWFENKLASVNTVFYKQPDVAFVQHNLQIKMNDELTNEKFKDILITGDYFGYTKNNKILPLFVPTTGLSFRKDILEKVLPIPAGFKTCADGYLTRTCFCFGEIAAINECLGVYRKHGQNNVFGNQAHSSRRYKKDLLFPSLNKFYAENGIDLNFNTSFINMIYENPPWKLLKNLMSDKKFETIENIISKFG